MKIDYTIDRNLFILLNFLNMLELFNYEDNIQNKINELQNLIEKKLFDDYKDLKSRDIVDEKLTLTFII